MTDSPADKRRQPRHDIPISGTLHYRGDTMPCEIRNISATGALIQVDANIRPGHHIAVEADEFGKKEGRVVRVIWKHAGIAFDKEDSEVEGFIAQWLLGNSADS